MIIENTTVRRPFSPLNSTHPGPKYASQNELTLFQGVCMLMVDPAHQRKGLGTRLAKRTTAIADENGKIMFVGAQDTSKKLFGECGFEVFKKGEYGFERWGGGKGEMMAFYAMRRRGNGGDDDDDGDDDGDKEALDDPHGL